MRLKPASDAVCTLLGRCFIDKVIRSFELTTDSSYSNDSVDCAVCHNTYHMYCVRPVLTKKPARGFAWACAACSRAQEKKLEARNTPIIGESPAEAEEEVAEEEEEEPNGLPSDTNVRDRKSVV